MRLWGRLAASRLTLRRAATASLACAVVAGLLTVLTLRWQYGWSDAGHIGIVSAIYAAGAGTGFAASLFATSLAMPHASRRRRTMVTVLLAVLAVLGATYFIFFLEHRSYYSQWHDAALTRLWFWQQAFTALGGAAQFAVMGIRYFGVGALALIVAASWWVHRTAH
ncbi:hypothetical protein [Oceaniradius stylonematis]|jgi:hypothetical protein|uniref:hypothetical protein n=1 Tax=Oceaniradius stylonematis TaxID=2184161 RepID=UPI000D6CB1CB|nr:hypothetical protein [Oceaniradius stylonematis]